MKLSSMGDVVHTLPAVSDAIANAPPISIDWACEEGFDAIARMHPGVHEVMTVPLRRWRRQRREGLSGLSALRSRLRSRHYDLVIDAQGLVKSAFVAWLAGGPRAGFDAASAREPFAAKFYGTRINVSRERHAVARIRALFAGALGYDEPQTPPQFGLPGGQARTEDRRVFFVHGTTWPSKHWPEAFWSELVGIAIRTGFTVLLPHGNDEEQGRAERLARERAGVVVLPRGGIDALYGEIIRCAGVVSVDSGLGHLAAASGVPVIGLYGATDPRLTGLVGKDVLDLHEDRLPCVPCLRRDCAFRQGSVAVHPPCFEDVTPERVWATLSARMSVRN
ncbi:MAG: lipopolysaccharide heptosyltransferase I [Pseudomonadales bacterium]|nr:lipopolysaccharide heptosyltransferase I [Pseudomonadales bacterium]